VTYEPSPADQQWQQEYTVGDYGQPQYQQGYPAPTQAPQTSYPPVGYPPQPGYQPGYPQPTAYPAQPGYPAPTPPPPAPAKRSNTGLIVAIVVAVLIVCGGAGVAGTIWLYKKSSNSASGTHSGFGDSGTGSGTGSGGGGGPAKTVSMGTTLSVTATDGSEADVTLSGVRSDSTDVYVTVTIVCTKGSFPVNPLYLTLTDGSGKDYVIDFGAEDKFLEPGEVPSGQTQTGEVAFTAPKSVLQDGVIELDAPFEAVGYWKLGG
jgi:hypothetical protein